MVVLHRGCTTDTEGEREKEGGEITKSRHAHASFICVSRYPNEKRQPPALWSASIASLHVSRYTITRFPLFFSLLRVLSSFSFRSLDSRALRVWLNTLSLSLSLSWLMQASQSGIHSARLSLNTNAHPRLPRVRFNPLFDSTI